MSSKPNAFISFHHDDLKIKEKFERMFDKHCNIISSSSVREGKIPEHLSAEETMRIIRDNHIKNSTITIVLIGENTYRSKFVDWEIKASLREIAGQRKRSALLGVFIPGIQNGCKNQKHLLPERLSDNLGFDGYAYCLDWTDNMAQMDLSIQKALANRSGNPKNNRPLKGKV